MKQKNDKKEALKTIAFYFTIEGAMLIGSYYAIRWMFELMLIFLR